MTDVLLATVAGALVVLSMSLNSALGLRIGVFRATAVNYVAGLAGALVLALVVGLKPALPLAAVPWWAYSGGILGVGIVVASNLALPRLSVVAATALIILGQLGAGLLLDALRTGTLPWQSLAGAVLVFLGAYLVLEKAPA